MSTPTTSLLDLLTAACLAVADANRSLSSVDQSVLTLDGMSSPKIRHLLNNLARGPERSYLEVGSWKGSTLSAALSNNRLKRVVAFENYAEFTADPAPIRECLTANIARYKDADTPVTLIEKDFFTSAGDLAAVEGPPFDLYLYDGVHTMESQYRHLQTVKPYLARYSILLVDDWFCAVSKPRQATIQGLNDFGYRIHAFFELPAGQVDGYWGGQGLFVVENLG